MKKRRDKPHIQWVQFVGKVDLPNVVESVHKEVDEIRKKRGLPRWCWKHKRVARGCKECQNPTVVTQKTQTINVP